MLSEIPPAEENVCSLAPSDMDSKCTVENSSPSLQSREPFCIDNDFSKSFFGPDILAADKLTGAFDSINIAASSGQKENEQKDNCRSDDASETKCSDIIISSSWKKGICKQMKGTCMSKSQPKTPTERAARKCEKAANKKPLSDLIMLKMARRRRSLICNRARSSDWGLFGNVTQAFERDVGFDVSQNKHKKSQKTRDCQGNGKWFRNLAGRSSRMSKGKSCASNNGICMKIKQGKEMSESCLTDEVPVLDDQSGKYWGTSTEFSTLIDDFQDKLEEDLPGASGFQCCNGNPEKGMSNVSVLDVSLASKYLDRTVVAGKSTENPADDHLLLSYHIEADGLGIAVDNRCLDVETLPDSEVINLIPDDQLNGEVQENLHGGLTSCQASVVPGDVVSLNLPMETCEKKEEDKLLRAGKCGSVYLELPGPEIINKARLLEKHNQNEKVGDGFYSSDASVSTTDGNTCGMMSISERFSNGPLPLSGVNECGISHETLKVESITEVDLHSGLGIELDSPESRVSDELLNCTKSSRRKVHRNSKPIGVNKNKSEVPDSAMNRRGNGFRQKGKLSKSVNKNKIKEKSDCEQAVCKVECHPETGFYPVANLLKNKNGNKGKTAGEFISDMVPTGLEDECLPPRKAWVCCDNCFKWRRIPATLADSIEETNCKWICKDNMDKAFADCSIPQEMSNAEINEELEISDASYEEDTCDTHLNSRRFDCKYSTVSQQSSWMLIKSNLFLHRSRKTQSIDEVMVCHCKRPLDGQMGCGDGCLNRMLNIECVQGTCPCGDLCSNQQFQRHIYARFTWFKCGKKGYGLKLQEDVSKGQFLVEYVGEVLDMHAYEARQKDYAAKGHKHFYFMTLNGSEVIDASAKGNLGRFINHSCDPNCHTEKWMVNGEVCIGLFALRDIQKGEEVTFDYHYVRVFGAAAKKCFCGSSQCRGYIGGDPLNAEVIVQGDSDEDYPEPVMVCEDGEADDGLDNLIYVSSSFNVEETQAADIESNKLGTAVGHSETTVEIQTPDILLKKREEINKSRTSVGNLGITTVNEVSVSKSSCGASRLQISLEMGCLIGKLPSSVQLVETSPLPDDAMSKTLSSVKQELSVEDEITNKSCFSKRVGTLSLTRAVAKTSLDTSDSKRTIKYDKAEDRRAFSNSCPLVKTSHSSSSVKKEKSNSNSVNAKKLQMITNKSHVLSSKHKKLTHGSSHCGFEAVEEKLNELLDPDGGISKQKDAPKGYLKLLLLTAASGDSSTGEAIQSNRDLSMILDVLLKTKSRKVLVDIINKNGLQMLHNIMKRYRRDFKKIPILRKLLKILEYLAVREILTSEHINGGPPCPGVESFKESVLMLTEHDDKQVHYIARNFRDRWIPRPVRKISCMNMVLTQRGSNCSRLSPFNYWHDQSLRPVEAIVCNNQSKLATPVDSGIMVGFSASCSSGCTTSGTKTRKRKSRWDQPAETDSMRSPEKKEPKIQPSLLQGSYSSSQSVAGEMVANHINGKNREGKDFTGCVPNLSHKVEANRVDKGRLEDIDGDIPPGFLPSHNGVSVSSNASSTTIDLHRENRNRACCPHEVIMGYPQGKFNSRLSISHGIPLSAVHQFGTPETESVEGWVVAPGVTFHPFPPLPPYSRDKRDIPCAVNLAKMKTYRKN